MPLISNIIIPRWSKSIQVTDTCTFHILNKVVNSVSVGILFFQLKWNVSVSECFGVPFRSCTVHIYIYIYIYIYIKKKK